MNNALWFGSLFVLLVLSAFFSAAEMAFSSASRIRLENLSEDGDRRARAACAVTTGSTTPSAHPHRQQLVNIASLHRHGGGHTAGRRHYPPRHGHHHRAHHHLWETVPKILAKKRQPPGLSWAYASGR
jgi:hypothetical protein